MVLILTAYAECCLGHASTEMLVATPKYEIIAFTSNKAVQF